MNSYQINAYSKQILNSINELNKMFEKAPIHEIVVAMSEYYDDGNYITSGWNLSPKNKELYDVLDKIRSCDDENTISLMFKKKTYFNPIKNVFTYVSGKRTYITDLKSSYDGWDGFDRLSEFLDEYISATRIIDSSNTEEDYLLKFYEMASFAEIKQGQLSIKSLIGSLSEQVDKENVAKIMPYLDNPTSKDTNIYFVDSDYDHECFKEMHFTLKPKKSKNEQMYYSILIDWLRGNKNITMEIKNV